LGGGVGAAAVLPGLVGGAAGTSSMAGAGALAVFLRRSSKVTRKPSSLSDIGLA
jgi:hypothetical protein